eukprot:TRINITY_DN1229_c0_g1_i7.p1 TRINITY_DN1229_c0_g1~~TRINITY_DN1229_c0_g1_i7.p1  ORF type:complete len:290 (-),score=65.49 TRINITY_DN1229_c0_g1_i7:593-1462(-)
MSLSPLILNNSTDTIASPVIAKEQKSEDIIQNNDIDNESSSESEDECEISLSEALPTTDFMLPVLNHEEQQPPNNNEGTNNQDLQVNDTVVISSNNSANNTTTTAILSENTPPIVVVASSSEAPNTETLSWFSKFYDKVSSTTLSLASTTSEHFSNASANISDSIRGMLFSHETQESFNQINQLIEMFFKDVRFSKVDMMIGLMLLNTYYRNMAMRSGMPVTDINFVEESLRYMKFANATYGWKCVYGFGLSPSSNTLSMLGAAVSMSDSTNLRLPCICIFLNRIAEQE